MKLAIFQPTDSDTISVLIPAPNCNLTLEEICAKDVPTGVKYKVIEHTDLPEDREFRNAWVAPDLETDFDGVGS
ncbi:MAG: hypothetical protein CBC12_10705 [Candidatus Puniceispirillum sp. TMED52]|nr:MAG: hypothetical protein CBC12_10705 [Candidatus Puniceispirillum sp. TMED52]|tara:strand:- start:2278 stop:2499 length:222 start_codon:yes stop_codon:yes gene_type:complete